MVEPTQLLPDFVNALNRNPLDSDLRLVVADWVQENWSEEVAEGWRWLAKRGLKQTGKIAGKAGWLSRDSPWLSRLLISNPDQFYTLACHTLPWPRKGLALFVDAASQVAMKSYGVVTFCTVADAEQWAVAFYLEDKHRGVHRLVPCTP